MTKTASKICFKAKLLRPAESEKKVSWTFLVLPKSASAKLPSRGMAAVEATLNGFRFQATLEPDGQKSHWLKVDRKLREAAGADAGDVVTLEIAPAAQEPKVPADLKKALASAAKARALWSDITPIARQDWIHWIMSAKQPETRARRVRNACSMLAGGKRRVCCFDRSGFYSKASAPRKRRVSQTAIASCSPECPRSVMSGGMKTKLFLSLLVSSALSIAVAEEVTLDSARPVVIKSVPEAGSATVDSSITEIRVTFSKDMQPGVWSWGMMNKESYPGTSESPKYMDDKRTCVLPVKLQPGKTYAVWVNTEKLQNFKDTKGMVAVPYLLVFKTRD